jgi:adenosylcobyric acid synthase
MLGRLVCDPAGIESSIREAVGLELLPVETELLLEKETHQALAYLEEAGHTIAADCNGVMTGYEIHMGKTTHLGTPRPFARIFRRGETSVNIEDGAVSLNGRILGTYLHGLFDNARFRETYLNRIRLEKGLPLQRGSHKVPPSDPFDHLADHLEQHLDIVHLMGICGLGQ